MEATLKPPDIAGMILIGKSFVIKGQVSCDGDLYIDGQVEGIVDPKGNRLTIGPDGWLKANVIARVVVVQGKLDGTSGFVLMRALLRNATSGCWGRL